MPNRTSLRGLALSGVLVGQVLAACAGGTVPAGATPAAGIASTGGGGGGGAQTAAGIPVSVAKVARDRVAQVVNYGGSISPKDQVSVLPRVAGRVVKTAADTGDKVEAGQVIAELDHATLDAQVAQANANIAGAIANVAAAKARYEGILAGPKQEDVAASQAATDVARVRLDQAKAGTRPEDIRSAEVAADIAKVRLDLAKSGGRAEDIQVAQSQVDAARNRLAQVEAGSRTEDIKAADADLATAKIRLQQLQNPRPEDVQSAQVALDQARTRLVQARDGGLGTGITAKPRQEDINTLELKVTAAQAALEKAWADQAKGPTSTTTAQALTLAVTTAQINILTAQNDLAKARSSGGPTEWDVRLLEEAEQIARVAVEKISKPAPADVAAAQVAVEKAQTAVEKLKAVVPFDVETARQAVVQAQSNLEKVKVTDPSTVAQLQQTYETAVVNLEKLRTVVQFDVDVAAANLAQAEAQLASRKNPYTDQDRAASEAAVRQAEAALAQQQAALAILQVSLNETQIVAPFSGVVAERLVTAGAVVQVTTPIVTLMSRETEIALSVEEAAISRFREGGAATFGVNAYPGQVFKGSVTSLFPTGDSRSRTFTVKVRPEDPDAKLKPGMYAQLSVTLDERRDVPVVPRDAIVLRGDKPFVFAVVDNVAQLRALELGLSDDKRSEVKSGVQADETIVINGQATLRDKDAIRVVQPGSGGGAGGQGAAGAGGRPGGGGQGAAGAGGQGAASAGGQGAAGAGGQGAAGAGGQGAAGAGGQGAAGAGGQGAAGAGGQGAAGAGGQGSGGRTGAGGQGATGALAGDAAAAAEGGAAGQRPAGGQGQRSGGAPQGGARAGGEVQPTPTRAP